MQLDTMIGIAAVIAPFATFAVVLLWVDFLPADPMAPRALHASISVVARKVQWARLVMREPRFCRPRYRCA